jgi:lytic murein transglycosylase
MPKIAADLPARPIPAGHCDGGMALQHSFHFGAALSAFLMLASPALAASCRNTENFPAWLSAFKQEAAAQGISQRTLASAAPYMTLEQRIIHTDRGQRVFTKTFLQFSNQLIPAYRLQKGKQLLQQHASEFARVEEKYGTPGPVIAAFWGLESDFGANMGKEPSLRALTTLAYDCRRGDFFRGQLMDALRLIDRGDLAANEMIGSWAGEVGQIQMMATEYNKYAVDFDGDGHRNLMKSIPDIIASAGNYIQTLEWRRGEPWLQSVRVSAKTPWDQSDLSIQHPVSQWAAWGVTAQDGKPLTGNLPASLVLPMGRMGPAFLAYPNFQVYLKWNQSLVYSLTAAYFATLLAGEPPMHKGMGTPPAPLNFEESKDLQQRLKAYGYTGEVDGKLGQGTRTAIKAAQVKLGLPADSYPTLELLQKLGGHAVRPPEAAQPAQAVR